MINKSNISEFLNKINTTCAITVRGTEGYCGIRQETQNCSMFKIDCAWTKLVGLGGPLRSTANPPQTKHSRCIPGHMALFVRTMCLEM